MNSSQEPAPDGLDDATFGDVLIAAQGGDERAVEWIFGRLQPRLLRFLVAHEPRAVDDLAGEVWLAVATRIGQFEGDWSDFRAWFFSIARRRLADHRRTGARRRTDVVDATIFDADPGPESTEQVVLDTLAGQEAAKLIASTLSGDQAEVLLLRVLGDLDVDQVAAIMERSSNWVRVTQHRAARTLAKRVGTKMVVIG